MSAATEEPPKPSQTYDAGCHCGYIKFEFTLSPPLDAGYKVLQCNCSACTRFGYLLLCMCLSLSLPIPLPLSLLSPILVRNGWRQLSWKERPLRGVGPLVPLLFATTRRDSGCREMVVRMIV
jgi:hypothetical protein